ncbi:MAG: hypothetical protein ABUT20_39645 [Bacteroidota bacterium]
MDEQESVGSFVRENKNLAKEYLETRLEIFRLSSIRMASKSAGYFVWVIISMFLVFLIVLFLGMTIGFWLSQITGSHVMGFGIVTAGLVVLFIILAVFRKKLFLEPLMQIILDRASEEIEEED